jgi:hypothetical protein
MERIHKLYKFFDTYIVIHTPSKYIHFQSLYISVSFVYGIKAFYSKTCLKVNLSVFLFERN